MVEPPQPGDTEPPAALRPTPSTPTVHPQAGLSPATRGARPSIAPGPGAEPPAQRSYTEKYRGTVWATAEPVSPEPGSGSSRRATTLVAIGALLLVVVIVGSVFALGQGGAAPVATPPLAYRPAASPTATPAIPDDPTVLDRFVAFLGNPKSSYRVAVTGTLSGSNPDAAFTMRAAVKAHDSDATARLAPARGKPISGREIWVIGSGVWSRRDGGKWQKTPLAPGLLPDPDPFLLLEGASTLVYLGPVERAGVWLHHIATSSSWVPVTGWIALSSAGTQLNRARMDIWVTSAGVPVGAEMALEIGIVSTAVRHSYTLQATYAISDVGAPITVKPPQ